MGWSDEQVERLRKMWLEGLTANEIAKKLGVTKNAIVGKVHRLCLQARPSPIKIKAVEEPVEQSVQISDVKIETIEENEFTDVIEVKSNAVTEVCKSGNVNLVDLDSHTCRWPIGDPRDDDFCFCGKKVKTGQTYCDEHSVMAYVKAGRK